MKPIVCPIQTTQINWSVFIPLAQKLLDRNIANGLDSHNRPVGDFASFISALGEFETPGVHPDQILCDPGSLLKQIFFGFLIGAPTDAILDLIIKSGLGSTVDFRLRDAWNSVVIVSGTLEQWRTAIINLSTERTSKPLREIMNEVLIHFESIGLHRIWLEYGKRTLKDNTFILESK